MATSTQDENLRSAMPLSSSLFLEEDVVSQSTQPQLNGLSLATERSLAAALAQSLSLASLCVAVSFVKWILLIPSKSPEFTAVKLSASYIFGVPYKVEVVNLENITTEEWIIKSSGVTGDIVLILMASLCFLSLIFGFVAFLLDFMKVKYLDNCQVILATSLHILAGLFVATLIAVCWWWFLAIDKLLNKGDVKKFHMTAVLGESFYLSLLSLAFVTLAVILSWLSMTVSEEGLEQHRADSERQKSQEEI